MGLRKEIWQGRRAPEIQGEISSKRIRTETGIRLCRNLLTGRAHGDAPSHISAISLETTGNRPAGRKRGLPKRHTQRKSAYAPTRGVRGWDRQVVLANQDTLRPETIGT